MSPALQADSLPSEPLHSIPPFLVTYILLINQQAAINSTFLIFFWISKITGNGYLIRKLLIKEIFLMSSWHWAQITSTLLGNLPQTFGQKKKKFFFPLQTAWQFLASAKRDWGQSYEYLICFSLNYPKKQKWKPHPLTSPGCISQHSHILWLGQQEKIQRKIMGPLSYCVRAFHGLMGWLCTFQCRAAAHHDFKKESKLDWFLEKCWMAGAYQRKFGMVYVVWKFGGQNCLPVAFGNCSPELERR